VVITEVEGVKAKALLDSGCMGNYINPKWLRKHQIAERRKSNPYTLSTFDDQPAAYNEGWVTEETPPITMRIGSHEETLVMDVMEISDYDITLGLPWLRKHEPNIGYKKGTVTFNNCNCSPQLEIEEISLEEMTRQFQSDPDSVRLAVVRLDNTKVDYVIPEWYKRFQGTFDDKEDTALSKHQPWDHEINLMEGKEPKHQSIYPLSSKELEVLREYIEVNKRKGYIRESTSPARYPILFVPKANGKLRLCVDYRRLNEITVKNRYTLPLIHEMQDRIQGAKIFTKLDLRDGYHKIRIKEGDEWKTAWGSRLGHYEYLVMPFGLTNAPATYQALINNILREYLDDFVVAYLDDILI
jgi:Reverse transcriptase (RNA-dependent DNA polymerase)/Retroviral aspartyl protease